MDIVYRDPAFAVRLKRDLAVLTTLAHLGCADFHHLHALCFPTCVAATARTHRAGHSRLFHRSGWMLTRANREAGQARKILPKGQDVLERYLDVLKVAPYRPQATEHDAWLRGMAPTHRRADAERHRHSRSPQCPCGVSVLIVALVVNTANGVCPPDELAGSAPPRHFGRQSPTRRG